MKLGRDRNEEAIRFAGHEDPKSTNPGLLMFVKENESFALVAAQGSVSGRRAPAQTPTTTNTFWI